jgi:hypothetical protein
MQEVFPVLVLDTDFPIMEKGPENVADAVLNGARSLFSRKERIEIK